METADPPISKIHINSSTKMSLNERFTVMQSSGYKPAARKTGRRPLRRSSPSRPYSQRVSMSNRSLLDELAKKHKILAAMKIKKRNLKASMPARRRNQNRAAIKKVIRVGPNGKLTRANSLSNIATLKSDYLKPAVRRSNSTLNLASRLGVRRSAGDVEPRRRLNRNNMVRRNSRTNLSRSNSAGSIRRSTSRQSLRRSNSRVDIARSNSRSRNGPLNNRNIPRRNSSVVRRGGGRGRGRGRIAQGRLFQRRNSTGSVNAVNNSARQGRISRTRGRGNSAIRRGNSAIRRGRSMSRNRGNNRLITTRGENTRGGGNNIRGRGRGRGGRGRGRGRSRSTNRGRGISRGPARKTEIKKEDLDKELDQYMATTKSGENDVLMRNSL